MRASSVVGASAASSRPFSTSRASAFADARRARASTTAASASPSSTRGPRRRPPARCPAPSRRRPPRRHESASSAHVIDPGTAASASRGTRARLPHSRRCGPPRAAAPPRARAARRGRSSHRALNPRLISPSPRVGIAASRRARSKLASRERRARARRRRSAPTPCARSRRSFSPSIASAVARCMPTRRGRKNVPPRVGDQADLREATG